MANTQRKQVAAQVLHSGAEARGSPRLLLALAAAALLGRRAAQRAHAAGPPRPAGPPPRSARQCALARHRRAFRGHGRRPHRAARGQRRASPPRPSSAAAPRSNLHYPGVFYLRGHQSRLYLRPSDKGDLTHDEVAGEKHLFAFIPGIGPRTGLVKLFNLATDSSLMLTIQGWLGCFAGDYEEHYWEIVEVFGGMADPTVYTDAFHAGHYAFDASLSQLLELREGVGMQDILSWGTAADLGLPEMHRPHAWAIEHMPLLRRLEQAGVIDADHPHNEVYLPLDFRDVPFDGNGLPPSNAIRFALAPVCDGRPAAPERSWLRAWHGPSIHALESIARQGLRCDKKGRIFLSPSFQYPFCLYSAPDVLVGAARFRLVLEVRVRPGSYWEHGDHYRFCATQHIERCVPEDCMEWELVNDTSAVQVVGLVLKQLRPDHPTLRHDTNIRHAGQSLLYL